MIFLKELTLISAKIHQENEIYVSIIILCLKILIIKDIFAIEALSIQLLTISYRNGHAYCVNFMFMSKNDAFNLIKNSIIIDKKGTL